MKTIILSLLLFISVNAQELLTLFADDGVTYSAEATQYFDRLPTAIPDDTLAFYAAFIDSMVSRDYWDRVDEMWFLANKTIDNALIGLKGLADATANGGYIFTPYQGWAGNGSSGYINTTLNDSTEGVQYKLNDAGYGFYSRTNSQSAAVDMGCATATNYSFIQSRTASNVVTAYINGGNSTTDRANTTSNGFIFVGRISSALMATYRNGVIIVGQNSKATTNRVNLDMHIGDLNYLGSPSSYSAREYSFAMKSAYFSAAEQVIIYGFIETLLDNLGAGVMP